MWKSNVKSTLEESRGMNSSETEPKYVIQMHILQNPNLTCSVPGEGGRISRQISK